MSAQRIDIDIDVVNDGAFLLLSPLTSRGERWFEFELEEDHPRHGSAVICAAEFSEEMLAAIRADGLICC